MVLQREGNLVGKVLGILGGHGEGESGQLEQAVHLNLSGPFTPFTKPPPCPFSVLPLRLSTAGLGKTFRRRDISPVQMLGTSS